jgi:hypothetical protein
MIKVCPITAFDILSQKEKNIFEFNCKSFGEQKIYDSVVIPCVKSCLKSFPSVAGDFLKFLVKSNLHCTESFSNAMNLLSAQFVSVFIESRAFSSPGNHPLFLSGFDLLVNNCADQGLVQQAFDHLLDQLNSVKTKKVVEHILKNHSPSTALHNAPLSAFIKDRLEWLRRETRSTPQFSWKILDDFATTDEIKNFLRSDSEKKTFPVFTNRMDAYHFISEIGLNSGSYYRRERPKIRRFVDVNMTDSRNECVVELKKTGEHFRETESIFIENSKCMDELMSWLGEGHRYLLVDANIPEGEVSEDRENKRRRTSRD